MTGEQLKKSILQYAIQGKLVPQNPGDESAKELLKKIRDEKQKLIAEKKMKKDRNESFIYREGESFYEMRGKEVTCIDEEIPFEIPGSWEWVRLGNVIELQSGQDFPKTKYNDEGKGIPYITGASNIENDTVCINRWTDCGKAFAYEGDLLLTCKGTIGKTAILDNEKVHIARQIMAIRNSRFLNMRYVKEYCALAATQMKEKAKSMIPGISRNEVLNLLFPLPPFTEQKRIVDKIEELLPYVEEYSRAEEALRRLNEKLPKHLKKSMLQYAIQGKMVSQCSKDRPAKELIKEIQEEKEKLIAEKRLKKDKNESFIYREDESFYEVRGKEVVCIDDEIPFEIPESWEWARLGSYVDVRDGTHDTPKYVLEGIPLVTSKNLSNGGLDFTTCKKISIEDHKKISQRSKVDKGDILFAMIGSIGNPVLCYGETNFSIKNMALFKSINSIENMEYLYYFLLFEQEAMKYKSSGAVQSFVSLNFLRNYFIPIPPLEEQKRIVAKIEEAFAEIENLKTE